MKKKDLEYRIDNADSLEELERAFGRTIKPQKHRKIPFRSKDERSLYSDSINR